MHFSTIQQKLPTLLSFLIQFSNDGYQTPTNHSIVQVYILRMKYEFTIVNLLIPENEDI